MALNDVSVSPQLLRLDEQLRYAKAVEHKPWKDDIAGDGKPGVPIAQQLPGAAVAKGSMLEETNIGYQMLRKAGWQPGMGLGAEGQGPKAPIALAEQSGRHGIGAGTKHQQQQQPARSRSDKAVATATQEGKSHSKPNPAQQSQPAAQPAETLDVRVRRHRQVLQAEADEAAGRDISRFIYSQFKDNDATHDTNPLSRRNKSKLSSTNPLLR